MKLIMIVVSILYTVHMTVSVAGEYQFGISAYSEHSSAIRSTGASIYSPMSFENVRVNAGISFSEIKSDENIENGRKTIHPFYLYVNANLNYYVSPFIEFGFDLGDSIIDEIFDNSDEYVDFYYLIGGTIKFTDEFSFSLYKKRYTFKFYDSAQLQRDEIGLSTYGASINYLF